VPPPNVPYHRQEGEDYCGAACLRMVIEALGLTSASQPALFSDAHGHGTQDPTEWWASPPDGVEWTLQNRTGQAGAAVVSLKSETPLTRRLVWSLFRHSVPPIALVYGWTHWVVVVNYDISRDPDGPSDTGYHVRALEIHNPWRTLEEGNPPPPPPPNHVTMKEWQHTYLKPVPSGHWKGKVVGVGVFIP
jgi:hypothetical protein